MSPRKRTLLLQLTVLVIGFGLAAWYWQTHRTPPTNDQAPGVAAEALWAAKLPDLNGRTQSLANWRGKPVVVMNFWASWCPPCQAEIPGFEKLQQQFAHKGVQFIGIAVDNPDSVKQFLQQTTVSYPQLVSEETGNLLMSKLGNENRALPYTLVLDANGRIRHLQLGMLPEEKLLPVLQQMTGDQ